MHLNFFWPFKHIISLTFKGTLNHLGVALNEVIRCIFIKEVRGTFWTLKLSFFQFRQKMSVDFPIRFKYCSAMWTRFVRFAVFVSWLYLFNASLAK